MPAVISHGGGGTPAGIVRSLPWRSGLPFEQLTRKPSFLPRISRVRRFVGLWRVFPARSPLRPCSRIPPLFHHALPPPLLRPGGLDAVRKPGFWLLTKTRHLVSVCHSQGGVKVPTGGDAMALCLRQPASAHVVGSADPVRTRSRRLESGWKRTVLCRAWRRVLHW